MMGHKKVEYIAVVKYQLTLEQDEASILLSLIERIESDYTYAGAYTELVCRIKRVLEEAHASGGTTQGE